MARRIDLVKAMRAVNRPATNRASEEIRADTLRYHADERAALAKAFPDRPAPRLEETKALEIFRNIPPIYTG